MHAGGPSYWSIITTCYCVFWLGDLGFGQRANILTGISQTSSSLLEAVGTVDGACSEHSPAPRAHGKLNKCERDLM